jgi:hypothetical protein
MSSEPKKLPPQPRPERVITIRPKQRSIPREGGAVPRKPTLDDYDRRDK